MGFEMNNLKPSQAFLPKQQGVCHGSLSFSWCRQGGESHARLICKQDWKIAYSISHTQCFVN